jgi:diphosphomevalonate decarboxylase
MIWKGQAPSNIALIKYMGKETGGGNRAVNPSLSMTLSAFRTEVELEEIEGASDRWRPLPGSAPLREESTRRFVEFFQKLKREAGVEGAFEIRSGNNFPSDAGLASSASSFAALTKTALTAFGSLKGTGTPDPAFMARISRTGSGSSCRSFFAPWCRWEGEQVGPVPSALPELIDLVAVMDGGFKKVSSSEAHRRVQTSPLFHGRVERATQRMVSLENAMKEGNYRRVAELSWEELWEMHSLFHTSLPPFFYFAPETLSVLRWAEERWEKTGHGPIATIDAGPNVHLLVPAPEAAEFRAELEAIPGVKVMESPA